jgi:CheY-like chemotaxis protein
MDGIETMKRIKQLDTYKSVPIFALTSYAMPEDEDRFMNDGFDLYLLKPIERSVLIERINRFVK